MMDFRKWFANRLIAAAAVALLLPAAVPAWAQDSTTSSDGQSNEGQSDSSWHDIALERSSDRPKKQQSQSQRQTQRDRASNSDRREARLHYRAGLAAGYMLGYADGMDDYVLVVASPGRDSATSQSSDEWRNRMRQRARDRATQQQSGQQSGDRTAKSKQQEEKFAGEIRAVKRVQLKNDNQRHVLLLVKSDSGKRRIVDAGPANQLQDLDLQKGDQVQVRGCVLSTRDNIPVLNARRVQSQGQSVAIRDDRQKRQRN